MSLSRNSNTDTDVVFGRKRDCKVTPKTGREDRPPMIAGELRTNRLLEMQESRRQAAGGSPG
jgi:hypothetical protein